jgi:DNA-binding MarR family transcriptional regulator
MSIDKNSIRQRALQLVAADGHGVGSQLAKEFGVSRQVANGYLQRLVQDGLLAAEGSTRARVYTLVTQQEVATTYGIEGLEEDRVWQKTVLPALPDLPANVGDIWHYGATEMINNAIDHSGAGAVRVRLERNALYSEVRVADEGIGIFLKIQKALDLADTREAILELVKGKFTTDPDNHTGEGIFFTSRAMDEFHIRSDRLHFRHVARSPDILDKLEVSVRGTEILMRLDNASDRDLRQIFDDFSDPEECTFDRTVIPMRLAQFEGQKLISRSQAKRIAHRFERFKRVELDFDGVESIGQAFADELFRVFPRSHPDLRLVPINVAPAVDRMIRRAVGGMRDD